MTGRTRIRSTNHRGVYVVGGLKRSGSTWQFNAVRALLMVTGHSVWGGGYDVQSGLPNVDADVYLVKEHRFIPALNKMADCVLTSSRSLDAAVASMQRMRGVDLPNRTPKRWRRNYRRWKRRSSFHMEYEDLVRDGGPRREIERLSRFLSLSLDDTTLDALCGALGEVITAEPDDRQDDTTLVFRDHFTSRDRETVRRSHYVSSAP